MAAGLDLRESAGSTANYAAEIGAVTDHNRVRRVQHGRREV